jgi:hypothetical protein
MNLAIESKLLDQVTAYEKRIKQIVEIKAHQDLSALAKELAVQRQKEDILAEFTEVFGIDLRRIIDRHIMLMESDTIHISDKAHDVFELQEFLKQNFQMSWLALNYFTSGSLYFLAGRAKAGKSEFSNYLAKCVVTGQPFLGMPVKQGNVLWFQLEESNASLARKAKRHGFKDIKSPYKIHIVRSLDLHNDFAKLERMIKEVKPAVVFLDTVRAAMSASGISEKATEYADAFYKVQALAIRENTTVICLHHRNKASANQGGGGDILDSVAGTSKLLGIGDGTVILERGGKDTTTSLHFITRDTGRKTFVVARIIGKNRTIDYELREEKDVDENVLQVEKQIIRVLLKHNSMTEGQIKEHISSFDFDKALDRLIESFIIDYETIDDRLHFHIPKESEGLWKGFLGSSLERDIALANQLSELATPEEIRAFTGDWSAEDKERIWKLLSKEKEQFPLFLILNPPKWNGLELEMEGTELIAKPVRYDDDKATYVYKLFDSQGEEYNSTEMIEKELEKYGTTSRIEHEAVLEGQTI